MTANYPQEEMNNLNSNFNHFNLNSGYPYEADGAHQHLAEMRRSNGLLNADGLFNLSKVKFGWT